MYTRRILCGVYTIYIYIYYKLLGLRFFLHKSGCVVTKPLSMYDGDYNNNNNINAPRSACRIEHLYVYYIHV